MGAVTEDEKKLMNIGRIIIICGWMFSVMAGERLGAEGGADWPMYRGAPALRGVASGTLPDKLALLWTFKAQGPVKSSAAIVGDRVFVGSDDMHLYALDRAKGTQVWAFKTEGGVESSPLWLEGRVYFGSSDSHVYALDAKDGALVWKFRTDDRVLSAPNFWRSEDGKSAIIVGSYDFKLYSLDAGTGRSNWVYETGNYINGAPGIAQGKAIFGGCDALLHMVSLVDGRKVREVEIGAYMAGSAALVGSTIYVGHYENEFLALDLAEGKRLWTYRDRSFPYFSSPAVAEGKVVFGGRDKRLHCVGAADGKSIWTFATRGKVDSSPVIVGDKVVVGSEDGRLYLVTLAEGRELWSYQIGEAVTASPAVGQGMVVVGAEDGQLYAFGPARAGAKP